MNKGGGVPFEHFLCKFEETVIGVPVELRRRLQGTVTQVSRANRRPEEAGGRMKHSGALRPVSLRAAYGPRRGPSTPAQASVCRRPAHPGYSLSITPAL